MRNHRNCRIEIQISLSVCKCTVPVGLTTKTTDRKIPFAIARKTDYTQFSFGLGSAGLLLWSSFPSFRELLQFHEFLVYWKIYQIERTFSNIFDPSHYCSTNECQLMSVKFPMHNDRKLFSFPSRRKYQNPIQELGIGQIFKVI